MAKVTFFDPGLLKALTVVDPDRLEYDGTNLHSVLQQRIADIEGVYNRRPDTKDLRVYVCNQLKYEVLLLLESGADRYKLVGLLKDYLLEARRKAPPRQETRTRVVRTVVGRLLVPQTVTYTITVAHPLVEALEECLRELRKDL